jgi:Holliday junction resolvasome RuvABC endonuclease subunit
MLEVLGEFKPERVVIEGYGLSWKHASSVIPMVEVGTVLRYFLKQLGYGYLEPTPNELKKAVTGNGNTAKSKMILHVFKRWGYEAKDDNRADAFGLGAIGLAHGGKLNNPTVAMREVVGALRLI